MAENHWRGMYEDPYAIKRVEKAVELLKKYCKSGTVVEVGCFERIASEMVTKGGLHGYIGYDSEKFHPHNLIVDLNKPFELFTCDAILCLEVLEHLLNPENVIQKLIRSCQKGFIIISLPNEATIFHRMRAVFGTLDAECFSSCGKHLHLPSLKQSRKFLSMFGEIIDWHPYINPSATGSRQGRWLGWMKWIPDCIWQALAQWFPSLMARGWIFVLKPHQNAQASN